MFHFKFANTFFILKDKPAAPKKGAELFDNEKEEDEELFSSKPKGIKQFAAPVKAKPSSNLFGDSTEDDLFSAPSQPPPGESKHTLLFVKIINLIIQQIVTLSKYGHDSLNICHP